MFKTKSRTVPITKQMVTEAYLKVKSNHGSAGIDKESLEEFQADLSGNLYTKDRRSAACLGFKYTLPMLILADVRIDTDGKFRFQMMREDVPLSKQLRMSFMVNSDLEYMAGLKYILTKNIALSSHYDLDMAWGAGITIAY